MRTPHGCSFLLNALAGCGGGDSGPDSGTRPPASDSGLATSDAATTSGPDGGSWDAGASDAAAPDGGTPDVDDSDGGTIRPAAPRLVGDQLCRRGWCWQRPLPHGERLRAVAIESEDRVWIGGDRGLLLRYVGGEWWLYDSGSVGHVEDLYVATPEAAWAVTSSGEVLRWDGSSWERRDLGMPAGLTSVDGVDEDNVWVVGPDGGAFWDGDDWTLDEAAAFHDIAVTPAGEVWGLNRDLDVVSRRRGDAWDSVDGAPWSELRVRRLVADDDGGVWVAGA